MSNYLRVSEGLPTTNKAKANGIIRDTFHSYEDAKLFKEFYHYRIITEVIKSNCIIDIEAKLKEYPVRYEDIYNKLSGLIVADNGRFKDHYVSGYTNMLIYTILVITDAKHLTNVLKDNLEVLN